MMSSASRIPNVILSTGAILSVCNRACNSFTCSGFNGSGLVSCSFWVIARNRHTPADETRLTERKFLSQRYALAAASGTPRDNRDGGQASGGSLVWR